MFKILAIKKDKLWFTKCPKCGELLQKNFVSDIMICNCGWKWEGITYNDKNVNVAYVQKEKGNV